MKTTGIGRSSGRQGSNTSWTNRDIDDSEDNLNLLVVLNCRATSGVGKYTTNGIHSVSWMNRDIDDAQDILTS